MQDDDSAAKDTAPLENEHGKPPKPSSTFFFSVCGCSSTRVSWLRDWRHDMWFLACMSSSFQKAEGSLTIWALFWGVGMLWTRLFFHAAVAKPGMNSPS
jgi:hypothetical protein